MNKNLTRFAFLLIIFHSLPLFSQTPDVDHTGTGTGFLPCEESSTNAQSFTSISSGFLNEIKIGVDADICPFNASLDTVGFVANIYDGNGTTGTLIASQVAVIDLPYSRDLFSITFDTPASVIAGNQYTMEFVVVPGQVCDVPFGIDIYFLWYHSGSNDYSAGQPYSTLSGNGINDFYFQTFVTTSSAVIFNDNSTPLTLLPNPASDVISIAKENNSELTLEIFDLSGRILVRENYKQSGIIKKYITELNKGIYLVRINSQGEQRTIKLIKE